MDFLNIILDIFTGSFTALYTFIQDIISNAFDAGLVINWNRVLKNSIWITVWIGSPFAAASVAESRDRNRLLHFMLGLAAPWIYPISIFFMLSKAREFHIEKEKQEEPLEETKTGENEIPESHLKHINKGENIEAPQIPSPAEKIDAKYFGKISTDEAGNSLGPYLLQLADERSIQVSRILETLPEVVVLEMDEGYRKKTVRFPYQKIKSCRLIKDIPEFQTSAPVKESDDISFISNSQPIQMKTVNLTDVSSGPPPPLPGGMLRPGEVIGNCQIVKILGQGGMSTVYLARHNILDIPVAMKIFSGALFSKDKPQCNPERFLREAKLAAKIKHPNVVAVMDAGFNETKNIYYIVLEYIDGGTLGQLIHDHGPLSEEDAICLLSSIGNALKIAEKHNVVHRDIKPDNIMLTTEGVIKLADLGLAKEFYRKTDKNTTTGEFTMGSPAYMSPEQAKDFKNADFRTDIYSLGVTLYHAITGEIPYTGDTALNVVIKLVNDPIPDPRSVKPEISEGMARICMKMMEKEPDNRFQSPQELLDAVANLSKGSGN